MAIPTLISTHSTIIFELYEYVLHVTSYRQT